MVPTSKTIIDDPKKGRILIVSGNITEKEWIGIIADIEKSLSPDSKDGPIIGLSFQKCSFEKEVFQKILSYLQISKQILSFEVINSFYSDYIEPRFGASCPNDADVDRLVEILKENKTLSFLEISTKYINLARKAKLASNFACFNFQTCSFVIDSPFGPLDEFQMLAECGGILKSVSTRNQLLQQLYKETDPIFLVNVLDLPLELVHTIGEYGKSAYDGDLLLQKIMQGSFQIHLQDLGIPLRNAITKELFPNLVNFLIHKEFSEYTSGELQALIENMGTIPEKKQTAEERSLLTAIDKLLKLKLLIEKIRTTQNEIQDKLVVLKGEIQSNPSLKQLILPTPKAEHQTQESKESEEEKERDREDRERFAY